MTDLDFLREYNGSALRIMEVCGTHTAAIFKSGIRSFLSPKIRLVSGPGCPVCVTVPGYIDRCIEISMREGHELLCFGDLLKVPGTERTLSDAKGVGGRVRMLWSPFDAIALAKGEPETVFVVAAIGFETTAPAFGLLLEEAEAQGVDNLRLITSLKSAVAAIDWVCAMGEEVDAFICPGHVSVVTGADAYSPLAERYGKPFVVAGFEGKSLAAAVRVAAEDAAKGRGGVRNLYAEAVSAEGNARAQAVIERHFEVRDEVWRGLGTVPASGYFLRGVDQPSGFASHEEQATCRCEDVILGRIDPNECPLFGGECTPTQAVGPCMVSAEGACGTWYRGRAEGLGL
ncbi:MAG: hydrogenase formation protein HypD [Clostridiales bacterium]|nr:hydrogenase formation protein HypD [Clostridiales bacterium]